jgi:hypothetical protein
MKAQDIPDPASEAEAEAEAEAEMASVACRCLVAALDPSHAAEAAKA